MMSSTILFGDYVGKMDAKCLNRPKLQFWFQNHQFPPNSTAGECKTDMNGKVYTVKTTEKTSEKTTKLCMQLYYSLDIDMWKAIMDKNFSIKLFMKSSIRLRKEKSSKIMRCGEI